MPKYPICIALLRTEPRLHGITTCNLVTILIMLTQLTLLAISLPFSLSHTMEKELLKLHSFQHNTYSSPTTYDKKFEKSTNVYL